MLPKVAYFIDEPAQSSPSERRRAQRRHVKFELDTTGDARGSRLLLLDLSESGLLFETSERIEIGEDLDLLLPEVGDVSARVVRRDGNQYGAEFSDPITRAVVSATILASPVTLPETVTEIVAANAEAERETAEELRPVPAWIVEASLVVTLLAIAGFIFAFGFLPVSG